MHNGIAGVIPVRRLYIREVSGTSPSVPTSQKMNRLTCLSSASSRLCVLKNGGN